MPELIQYVDDVLDIYSTIVVLLLYYTYSIAIKTQ
jgi:hypothetical protein